MNKRLVIVTLCIVLGLIGAFQLHDSLDHEETFSNWVFKYGAVGKDVKELQGRLKYLGYYHGKIDGEYGWKTLQAVKWFQGEFGLKVDGVIGAKTKLKLWEATKAWTPDKTMDPVPAGGGGASGQSGLTVSNSLGLTENDINLMANAVYGESRGEPYVGQVAVAAVILNRVQSATFPNTVSGVIFEPRAFTAVADGQIWLAPNATAKKAVKDAINGWDPTGGCIYYFNPATATNAWIWSRPQVKRIGKHIFCR